MIATAVLHQLTQNIKIDLDFAKENVKLAQDVEFFQEQRDFWEGKVEALEHVVVALEATSSAIAMLENKKDSFIRRMKSMFAWQ